MKEQIRMTESEAEDLLARTCYQIQQARGRFQGFTYEQYRDLRNWEDCQVRSQNVRSITPEKVFEDLQRYGSFSEIMNNAFLSGTIDTTRSASLTGRHGEIVYFAKGEYINSPNELELGLVSSHMPGSSGGVGWGMDGIRRLVIARKQEEPSMDPEIWLKNTVSFYRDSYDELSRKDLDNDPLGTLLMILVEKEKAKLKGGIKQ